MQASNIGPQGVALVLMHNC